MGEVVGLNRPSLSFRLPLAILNKDVFPSVPPPTRLSTGGKPPAVPHTEMAGL